MKKQKKDLEGKSILIDQVKELYSNLFIANLSILIICSFLAWVLWPVTPLIQLLAWYLYTLTIFTCRSLLGFFYRRAKVNRKSVQKWLNAYIVGVILSGIGCGATLFIAPTQPSIYLVAIIFLMAGIVTGSAASLAGLKYGFAAFSIPTLLPGAVYLIYLNESITFLLGCSIFTFLIFIYFIALRIHKTIFYSLRQQFEMGNLLAEVEAKYHEIEARNSKLEAAIKSKKNEIEKLKQSLKNTEPFKLPVQRGEGINLKDERFRTLLEKLEGGVWDLNFKSGEIIFSKGWLEMLGYSKDEVSNHVDFWKSVLHPDDKLTVLNKLYSYKDGQLPEFISSHRLRSKSGDWIWVMTRAHGVGWGSFGEILKVVGIEINIANSTETMTDTLNILNLEENDWFYSPEKFRERLDQVLLTADIDDIEHSLFYIRIIDRNSGEAHDRALDEILTGQSSRLILKEFRQGDAIVHLDDDSFAVLVEFCSIENAWSKAVAVQKAIDKHQFTFMGVNYRIPISIGITPFTNTTKSSREIFADAKTACDIAYKNTENHIYLYQKDNEDLVPDFFEKQIISKLRDTILNKRPRIKLSTLKSLNAEANTDDELFTLGVELNTDEYDSFPGADYRMIAEKNNLTADLELCAIEAFFKWVNQQQKSSSDKNHTYFIDFSCSSLLDEYFIDNLKTLSADNPMLGHTLVFGITEKLYSTETAAVMNFIESIKSMGWKFALTQVGTTALSHRVIRQLPMQYLKIDNSLVNDIQKDESSLVTVKYIIEIAHLAGITSIAENVDNPHLLDKLKSINMDYVQGDGFGKPAFIAV